MGARRLAARIRPGVIYTRDLGLAAFLLRRPFGPHIPVVYESHGLAPVIRAGVADMLGQTYRAPSARTLRRLDRRERYVWRHAHAYVTLTRALADELSSRYGARERVFVVPDGAYPSGPAPGGRPARPIAAYAGHLYPWKGVDVFVRALALAPDVAGLIIGGHPQEADRARIERLAEEVGVSDRLEITGLVAPPDVAAHLARASMLSLPNTATAISERYTSPLKLFEYLWTGLPIVASDLPAIREVLTHGRTAWLVPPGEPHALAAAWRTLAADPALSTTLGSAARAMAPDFTWSKRAERLEPVLAAAVAAS
jgi:glycosyltransferase involved in cell wall biosynthesis